jgi:hypothetical protein
MSVAPVVASTTTSYAQPCAPVTSTTHASRVATPSF